MTGYEVTASHNGWCPCGKYIRARVSRIANVGVALPPCPSICWYSGEKQRWYIEGAEGSVRARMWLHAACAERLDGLSFEELELLAADRRQELACMKRRGDREGGRNGVRRHQCSKRSREQASS
jgi:hypothetical protein